MYCDFPKGVIAHLAFSDTKLDTYQIFQDYDYNTTDELLISLPDTKFDDYDAISNVKFSLNSAQISTTLMIGAIENLREYRARCILISQLHVFQGAAFDSDAHANFSFKGCDDLINVKVDDV